MLKRALLLAALLPGLLAAQEAKIMTWNLGGFTPISLDKIKNQAKVIAELQPDLIAVQEMTPLENFKTLVEELNQLGFAYKARHLQVSNRQVLGFIAREGVWVAKLRLVKGSDDGNSRLRKALVATVRIHSFDFYAVNLHLKAGRGTTERSIRTRQCTTISKYLKRATRREKDAVVVGDYNMVPGQDQDNFDAMVSGYSLTFLSDAFVGRASHLSLSGGGNLLDGFAVSPTHTSEYIPNSIQLFESNHLFPDSSSLFHIDHVSDHLPMLARFNAATDDD
jgi:endonuclease/exonuclease/phosphatase family metal-dependent hydrolase